MAMSETPESEPPKPPTLDDPAHRAGVVRALLIATPFLFVFCYILAWAQGAEPRHAVLIAAVGAGMSLSSALAIHVMGSKAVWLIPIVKLALLMAKR